MLADGAGEMRQREMGRGGGPIGTEARNGRLRWPPEIQDYGETRPQRQKPRERHTHARAHTHAQTERDSECQRQRLRLRKTQLKI